MIDIETEVYDPVRSLILAQYPDAYVTGEYIRAPAKFPAVCIEQTDNTAYGWTQDSDGLEHDAYIMFEVNIYSNRVKGKKAEAKALAAIVDEYMLHIGFTRTFLNPIPNLLEATVYRLTARYQAIVSKDHKIYRRT